MVLPTQHCPSGSTLNVNALYKVTENDIATLRYPPLGINQHLANQSGLGCLEDLAGLASLEIEDKALCKMDGSLPDINETKLRRQTVVVKDVRKSVVHRVPSSFCLGMTLAAC